MNKPLVENRPLSEKCELVSQFFAEIWGVESLMECFKWSKDKPAEPPTAKYLEETIINSSFPGIKLLEFETVYAYARLYFDMKKSKDEFRGE